MPRISAASFRFQRVLVSIRRISSRSASRAAVREMSLSEMLAGALAPAGAVAAAEIEPMPAGAPAIAMAASATAGGGMTGCGGGLIGRGAEEEVVCGQWLGDEAGC